MNPFLQNLIVGLVLTSVTTFLLGLFVYLRKGRSSLGRIFFLYCFFISWWSLFEVFHMASSSEETAIMWGRMMEGGMVFIPAFFVHFVLIFLSQRISVKNLICLYGASFLFGVLCFTPLMIKGIDHKTFGNFAITPGPLYPLMLVFFVSCVFYGHFKLYDVYVSSSKVKRVQMGYLFWSSVAGYIGGSTNFLLVFDIRIPILNDYGTYAVPLYVGATSYAIVRYQFMDIRTVIHKTAMWIAISSVVLLPIAVMFYVTHTWIGHLTPTQLALFVWGLTILLIPYVRFVQPKIDHLFQRRKYDMQKTLQGLIQELAGLKNVDLLFGKIAETIQLALYVSKIILIIWDDKKQNYKVVGSEEKLSLNDPFLSCMKEQDRVIEWDEIELNPKYESVRPLARSYFQKFNAKVVLPLIHDGKLVGIINLGEKDNLNSFSKVDLDFLSNLRTEASIALSNSLLYDNVNKMSEELKQWSIELEHKVDERTRELGESKKELEQSYAKLKELDQIKTDFFANVNHELRTPLTLILLPLEMALNKEYGELTPELQKSLATVKTNGLRLLNLINGLLDLAKTDAGKMELYKNKYDLSLIVQGMISSLSLMADKKNIRLTFEAKTPIPEFYFDREKIERVFINLISNALKFTDFDGSIEVVMELKKDVVEARIKDSGIGIPESALEKIFERFTQVDSSSSRKYQGSGLGLTLCKEFVELHEGKIRAESELGVGSTFILTLPLLLNIQEDEDSIDRRVRELETKIKRRNEDLTKNLSIAALYESTDWSKPVENSEKLEDDSLEKYQILIVEDHAQMREYIGSILKKEYRVLTAQNGLEGVEKIKAHLPDLVISDLMMPLKDGYQLCKEVKTDKETRHIPIILLTAKSDLSFKIEGFEYGANEYLSKPFNAEELQARVRSLLQLKELEKENAESKKMAAMAVMVAGVIHEINNPISFTRTSWSTISESFEKLKGIIQGPELRSQQQEISELIYSTDTALEIVHKGIERIQQVINRLRVFDGRQSLQFEPLQMNQLLDRLVSRMDESFTNSQKEQIHFYKEYHFNELVEGIPVLLTQTFEVMIDNAVKATHGTGSIWIKTWQGEEGKVWISIKDNGCGIKKEKLDHLFEPFFTLRDVGSGMGLGLFLAYQVIQAHHGSVTVSSAENEGTEMIIQLPLVQPQNVFLSRQYPYQTIL